MGMKDFRAEGNRILDAGDDSFFLQGEEIRVIDNVAVRFMDEGIDLSYDNTEAVLRSNCLSSGRIGIAISVDHPVVNDNVVEDFVMHGIYVNSTDALGIITGNVAKHTRQHAIFLRHPVLVSRNQVEDSRGTGIRIRGMRGGIVQENIVRDSDVGFELLDITESFVHLNRYEGEEESFLSFGDRNEANTVRENTIEPLRLGKADRTTDRKTASLEDEAASIIGEPGASSEEEAGTDLLAAYSVHDGECLGRLAIRERGLLEISLAARTAAPLKVEARSDRDRRLADQLLKLWNENNPGFLAINIDGPLMTTPITAELLTTLRGAGMKAIGIVRYPAMLFGRMNESRDAEWHLLLDGSRVATVRPSDEGPGAVISFE
jgi:nitrous oxidase accessory protein NosD